MGDKDTDEDRNESCYENDLYLSAELGKMLLEKNRELEINLKQSHHVNEERILHIKFLEKECQTFREAKAKELDQMDSIIQDLEKANELLQKENKTYSCKVNRLTEMVEILQKKVEEHTKETEINEQGSALETHKESLRGISNVADSTETAMMTSCHLSNEIVNKEIISYNNEMELQETIQKLKTKLAISENKREEIEIETSVIKQKNEVLQDLTKTLENRIANFKCESELFYAKQKKDFPVMCSSCGIKCPSLVEDQESDSIKCSIKNTSTNQASLLPENEIDSDIQTQNISIFGELDSEYQNLIKKYNELLLYCKSSSIIYNKALDAPNENFGSCLSSESINFEKSSPSYRKLFNEIFELIRKQHKI